MPGTRAVHAANRCRRYTTARDLRTVPILATANLETFREKAFKPETPTLLPRSMEGSAGSLIQIITLHLSLFFYYYRRRASYSASTRSFSRTTSNS